MAFVTVEGEVTRLHKTGSGFGLKESWEANGSTRMRFWAVFPKDQVQVSEGERVTVKGGLQTTVSEPKRDRDGNERVYVDHVVGQARVEPAQGEQPQNGQIYSGASNAYEAPATNPWANQPQPVGNEKSFDNFRAFDEEPF